MQEGCCGRVDGGASAVYVERDGDNLPHRFLFYKGSEMVLRVTLPDYEPAVDVDMVEFKNGHLTYYYQVKRGQIRIDAKESPEMWAQCSIARPK